MRIKYISHSMGEVRVGLKIQCLKVGIYVIFSLFGPLVVMFDIFHNLFFGIWFLISSSVIPENLKQIGWDLKNGVIWPIHPVKGVKEIKHVKINFYSLINHYKAILTPCGYVTILPPGGDGAKVVIAFNSNPFLGTILISWLELMYT